MASEGFFSISVASVVEDVIKQQGTRLSDVDLASRRAEEAATRRSDAAGWLRRTVGVVVAKDLPEQPSEEEFRLGLRNGIILCNVFMKVQPGLIPKVVEAPGDSAQAPDGAALSAYQYFENVRNFLVGLEELGLPTFEASDLEKGGKGSRVVDSVLALKAYTESKQNGKNNSWKYGGILKPASAGKYFIRKNSEPFTNSLPRSQSLNDKIDGFSWEHNLNGDISIESTEMKPSHSLNMLVRTVLSDKKPEEVPFLVEAMLSKVMQEFERRIASQNDKMNTSLRDLSLADNSIPEEVPSPAPDEEVPSPALEKIDVKESKASNPTSSEKEDLHANLINEDASRENLLKQNLINEDASKEKLLKQNLINASNEKPSKQNLINEAAAREKLLKQRLLFDRQQREIEELKHTLHATKDGMESMRSQYFKESHDLGKHLQILSHAASRYHKVLEENRKLYNQIQDLKGNIRVYCRVRPSFSGQLSGMSPVGRIEDGSITIITPSKYGKEGRKIFNFNKTFGPSATQAEVFADTQPLIRSVLDGYNVCIFAYGQTGSGKTHTMSGPNELNEETVGVNYRALNDLFYLSEQRRDTFYYEISVQMIEIYNEQVRDLLANDGVNKRLEIRNSSQKGFNVPDANLVPVASTSDVIDLMNLGQKNRAVSYTAMNDRSSRSHSCLTIHVQGKDLTSGATLRGTLHLVDLAGSERVDKSEVKGDRLKEAQHINKSLAALGDVIASLAQKNAHVPYRNSKLTQLLQDSLGGQAKTLMFVHISPEADAVGETLSTLKFAERVATVELGAAKSNKESGEVKELREQIASLKAALARKELEPEPIRSTVSSPEMYRVNTHEGDVEGSLINHWQPMEDIGNLEARNNSAPRQKKPNFDFQELATDSPWPDRSIQNLQKGEEIEMGSGDWVDKIMVNKLECIRDDESVGEWEGDGAQLPEAFYQRYPPNMRKESHEFEMQRSRFDSDSDDLEIATSDSSEVDMQWQINLPKTTGAVNGSKSKIKKPQSKPTRSSDTRTTSHAPIPSPARKVSNGSVQTPNRTGRPRSASGVDAKRSTTSGKPGHGK